MPMRAKVASSVSRTAAALSRAAGSRRRLGDRRLDRAQDRSGAAHPSRRGSAVALVSGTNGKTTTTKLTVAALGPLGRVATNAFGANMPTGHTSALAKAGATPYAVLEVDEHYLARVLEETSPRAVALLNLSRDQLDRAKEVAMMAQMWRTALAAHPGVHVVANADDPMVTWAAIALPRGHLVQRRPALARRLLGLPRVRRRDRAGRRRLAVHQLPAAPAQAPLGGRGRRGRRPDRRVAPGPAPAARHGQHRQRGHRAGRGRPVRRTAGRRRQAARARSPRSPGRYAQVERDGRQHPAAAREEPGELARGVRHGRGGADAAVHQRPRPRRPGHVVAVRRGLLPAARAAGADHRRPRLRPGRAAAGQRHPVRTRHVRSPTPSRRCRPAGSK